MRSPSEMPAYQSAVDVELANDGNKKDGYIEQDAETKERKEGKEFSRHCTNLSSDNPLSPATPGPAGVGGDGPSTTAAVTPRREI